MNKSIYLSMHFAFLFLLVSMPSYAATIYTDSSNFMSQLTTSITDGYDGSGYSSGDLVDNPTMDRHTDSHMSSVLGETQYTTTGYANSNLVFAQNADARYCAGCNGSFLLDFTSTSIGDETGVFGVGLDVIHNDDYYAFVTFGNNSTSNYLVSDVSLGFWGITSELSINTIHFGLIDGGVTINDTLVIDNLVIGSSAIPLPAAVWLFSAGLLGLLAVARRRAH